VPAQPTPDFGAMFAVHDAVRRDLGRAVSLTGGTSPVSAGRAVALRSRWALLCGVVAAHEQAEDTVLWPRLRAVLPAAEAGPLDVAADQHEALDSAMAEATRWLTDPGAFADRAGRERVTGALQHMAVRADHHFGLEERRLLPLVATWLDPADWWEFVRAWSAAPGPGGLEHVLPFLLDGSHPDRAASVLDGLDPEQRTAYSERWRPAYKAATADLW
jgi:Hemerythrin HHE cation binding domain